MDSPAIREPLLQLLKQKLPPDQLQQALNLLAKHGGPVEMGMVVRQALANKQPNAEQAQLTADLLNALVETTRLRKLKPDGDLKGLEVGLTSSHVMLQAAAARAVGAWSVVSLRDVLAKWTRDASAPQNLRWAAMDGEARFADEQAVNLLSQLAVEGAAADRAQALGELATIAPVQAGKLAATWLGGLTSDASLSRRIDQGLTELLARAPGAAALAEALNDVALPPDVAQLATRTVQRSAKPSSDLLAVLRTAGGLESPRWKAEPELMAELVAEVAAKSDPLHGEAVYRLAALQCQKCHAIAGAGGKVGPDLLSIGGSAQVDYLIESLLDPNRKVKENYNGLIVQTDDGKAVAGVIVRQDERELVLRDAEDREIVIPRNSIEDQQESRSLMPDGLTDSLTRQELVDLVRFLSDLGKVGGVAADRSPVVRRWLALNPTNESYTRIRRTSYDSAAIDDPAFQWTPAYSRVSGDLPLLEIPGFTPASFVTQDQRDRVQFLRFTVQVRQSGNVQLRWNSLDGVALYIDGKPTPHTPTSEYRLVAGPHVVTLAISRHEREAMDLRVEVHPGVEDPAVVELP